MNGNFTTASGYMEASNSFSKMPDKTATWIITSSGVAGIIMLTSIIIGAIIFRCKTRRQYKTKLAGNKINEKYGTQSFREQLETLILRTHGQTANTSKEHTISFSTSNASNTKANINNNKLYLEKLSYIQDEQSVNDDTSYIEPDTDPLLKDDSNQIYSNDDSNAIYSNDDSNAVYSNDDSNAIYLNDDSNTIYLNDDSNTIYLNDDSNTIYSNDDSNTIYSNDDSSVIYSDSLKNNDSNVIYEEPNGPLIYQKANLEGYEVTYADISHIV